MRKTTGGIAGILRLHLKRYPESEIQDDYKLIHQAAMGSGHAVRDADKARGRLEAEMEAIAMGSGSRLFDPISPDGKLVRIHLGPYLQTGLDPEMLLEAFVNTAREYPANREAMREYHRQLQEMLGTLLGGGRSAGSAGSGETPGGETGAGFKNQGGGMGGYFHRLLGAYLESSSQDVVLRLGAEFLAAMAEDGYPAVHHSERYRAAYRPAYRVIWLPAAGEAIQRLVGEG